MRFAPIAALIALVAIPATAFAQTAPPSGAAPAPAAARSGEPMSPEAKERMEKFRAACGADLQTHCAGIARGTEQGRGEMRQCIETHKAKFSATCQAAVAERDANREARKQSKPSTAEKPKS